MRRRDQLIFEFAHISLPEGELEQLREMVLNGRAEPYHFYPITLIQLSTRNMPHNKAPDRLTKREPLPDLATGEIMTSYPQEQGSFQQYN